MLACVIFQRRAVGVAKLRRSVNAQIMKSQSGAVNRIPLTNGIGLGRDTVTSTDLVDEAIDPTHCFVEGEQFGQAVLFGIPLPTSPCPVSFDDPSRYQVARVDGPDGIDHREGETVRITGEGFPVCGWRKALSTGADHLVNVGLPNLLMHRRLP
jgi:hypothetical protein